MTTSSNKTTGNTTLLLFLGLSAMVHGAIFLGYPDNTYLSSEPIGLTLIQTTLVSRSVQTTNQSTKTNRPVSATGKSRTGIATSDNAAPHNSMLEEYETISPTTPSHNMQQNFLSGKIQTQLDRYLVYPRIARLRGWEGKVILGLRLTKNGKFEKIKIMESSGYSLLDNTALEALNKLNENTTHISWLQGYNTDLLLPVVYQLTDY